MEQIFRPMRRNRQELPQEECIKIIENATAGVLCVLGDNGYPYGVPISFVYHEGVLFFHSALEGHKIDAIRAEEKCSFTIIAADDVQPSEYMTYYRSVIAFGRIRIIEDEGEKIAALRMLGEHYNPGHPTATQHKIDRSGHRLLMLRMDIEHLSGKVAKELVGRSPL